MLGAVVERAFDQRRVKPKLKAFVQEALWNFERTAVWLKWTAILRVVTRMGKAFCDSGIPRSDLLPIWPAGGEESP